MTFAPQLLEWYARNRRPLPWRDTRDPYALLVSEVMLQQTQAARVIPYYEAFLERFPDPAALAAASPREVLEAWSGLGYNRRALALQAAARVVAAGGWPDDLTTLPGVGPYTAAAVGSFAWDRQEAAIDTNARRVIERFDATSRTPGGARRPRRGAAAGRPGRRVQPGDDGARRHRLPPARAALRRVPGARRLRDPRGRRTAAGDPRRGAGRFEDSERWARGRIVAALLSGAPLPAGLTAERRERALAALERDGLVVRGRDGSVALPEH